MFIAAHCDICGIKALDNESFAEERIPFRRARKYCPACRARFYERIQIGYFFVFLLAVFLSLLVAIIRGTSILNSWTAFGAVIVFLQYLLTIPHELGHALAARIFGFSQIRIIIGSGKPLFHFRLLGFGWLINRVPFGGLAHAKPEASTLTRAKWIIFVSGGLMMNAAFLLVSWFLIPEGGLADSQRTFVEAFFWSNLIVIAENLAPYTVQTGFGPLATDGKLLYDAIFLWNKPPPQDDEAIPAWSIWTARILKTLVLIFLSVCTFALAALAYVFAFAKGLGVEVSLRVGLSALFILLTATLGYYTWRIYSQPVATKHKAQRTETQAWLQHMRAKFVSAAPRSDIAVIEQALFAQDFKQALAHLRDPLLKYPGDIILLTYNAICLSASNDHLSTEKAWDLVLTQITPSDPIVYGSAYVSKIEQIMAQGQFNRFLAVCKVFLSLPIPDSQKLLHLDELACNCLYLDQRERFEYAEFCVRKALEIAPGNLTLRGTLGALLVERGRFDEAEPYLRACHDRSRALHDQGISGVYLALIAEHRGDLTSAESLARQSIVLYSESWLTGKAEALFGRLEQKIAIGS